MAVSTCQSPKDEPIASPSGSEVACDDYALALFQQLAQFLMLSSLMIRAIIVSANLVIIHELAKKIRGHPGRGL